MESDFQDKHLLGGGKTLNSGVSRNLKTQT